MVHGAKIIHDIPSVGAELLPLKHDGVEEAESEEQFLGPDGVLAVLYQLPVYLLIVPDETVFDALGLLIGDLDPFLQYADRELLKRHQREPHAEVLMQVGTQILEVPL